MSLNNSVNFFLSLCTNFVNLSSSLVISLALPKLKPCELSNLLTGTFKDRALCACVVTAHTSGERGLLARLRAAPRSARLFGEVERRGRPRSAGIDEPQHLLSRLCVKAGERLVQHHDLAFAQDAAHLLLERGSAVQRGAPRPSEVGVPPRASRAR